MPSQSISFVTDFRRNGASRSLILTALSPLPSAECGRGTRESCFSKGNDSVNFVICLTYLDKKCMMQSAVSKRLQYDGQRPGNGRKCTVNTSRNRKAIEKRIQRNPRVSMKQITRDMGISDRSVN
ncbi:hypothetical protein TNCV_934111 [Trichonephila clavipes]|nr:hypothetical protein TNCV_934111 [Trichonephila clavipes]